jgi:hypothetical protein
MIALCAGLIITGLGFGIMPLVIYGLALTGTFTVLQRIWFVRNQLKK